MSPQAKLREYQQKRDFAATPEPSGNETVETPGTSPRFVIQKHAARSLHYDFRLEMDGVLKSWAVPKGPPARAGERRLAVATEDHPLDYSNFEGVIPAGHYGAGQVIIWDTGCWKTDSSARKQYQDGKLSFELYGKRLQGRWTLVRTRGQDTRHWLLIKRQDDEELPITPPDPSADETSVVSGRSLAQLHDDLGSPPSPPPGTPPRPLTFKEPQIPRLTTQIPAGDRWLHEIKLDGYRILAAKSPTGLVLYTRNGKDWTDRFPDLANLLNALPCESCLIDGEVVVYNPDGTTDFQALQNALRDEAQESLHYVAFDLLYLDGHDLAHLALHTRKEQLERLLASGEDDQAGTARLQRSDGVVGNGPDLLEHACTMGLEGLVSKHLDAPYRPGKNSQWVKTKCINTDEFVIGGYTEPKGSRSHLGALLLGYHQNGQLIYSGRVGTGFDQATLASLHDALRQRLSRTHPFDRLPPTQGDRIHWVRPELVAQIRYSAWTRDGLLRHPVFQGLREDKPATQVHRETPIGLSSSDAESVLSAVHLTHPNRVLFDEMQLTKRDLALYYTEIWPWIEPWITRRPLSLLRCPSGAHKACFFQRHPQTTLRAPVRTVTIDGSKHVMIDSLEGLLSLVQYGVLEIHPWGAKAEDVDHPDRLTFDLDPGPEVAWSAVIASARLLHNQLLALGLQSFVMLTGGKGIHLVVPLLPHRSWEEIKTFAQGLARSLERSDQEQFTATSTKAKRTGKIFIDYLRNSKSATSIACYSTRARAGAPVATPLRWDELSPRTAPDQYNVHTIRARLKALGNDPWGDYFDLQQQITDEQLSQYLP